MPQPVNLDLLTDLTALKRLLNALADKAIEEGLELHIAVTPIDTKEGVINNFEPHFVRRIYAPEAEAPELTVVP